MNPFTQTCKQVAALLVAREDRALTWEQRLSLRLHMLVCEACPRFERQMLTMRSSMRAWRNYVGADDADGHSVKP